MRESAEERLNGEVAGMGKGKLLSPEQLADYLGVSVSAVKRMRRRRQIPYLKFPGAGGSVRFRPEDVRAFENACLVKKDF